VHHEFSAGLLEALMATDQPADSARINILSFFEIEQQLPSENLRSQQRLQGVYRNLNVLLAYRSRAPHANNLAVVPGHG
jgi:hypothetical protein